MRWWFGSDNEDDTPPSDMNGDHRALWSACHRIHTRLARMEVLVALGVTIGLLALAAQIT